MFKYSPKRARGGLLSPSFADALSTLIIIFISLFVLTIIRFNDPNKQVVEQPDYRAAIIIIMEWSDISLDDVDIYVQNPEGKVLYFNNRDTGWMNLDRDMRGKNMDGSNISRETVNIRKLIEGEYIVNIHMYAKRDSSPTPVRVRILKTLGGYEVINDEIVTLTKERETITVLRFTVTPDNKITNKNKLSKILVQ